MAVTATTHQVPPNLESLKTGKDVRLYARSIASCPNTSGLAPTYVQANLIVLPSRYASDFRQLCARNPVPCPLIGESPSPGIFDAIRSRLPGGGGISLLSSPSSPLDIRRDCPKYNIYKNSQLFLKDSPDILSSWTSDHVAFLIGCSFSFETSLSQAGFPPQHTFLGRNVPMYRTSIPLNPAGVFRGGTYVVSMRAYRKKDVEEVRRITSAFSATHGEPLDWGWDAVGRLGIGDLDGPEWGDEPLVMTEGEERVALGSLRRGRGGGSGYGDGEEDLVPVFWGCGVTPQEAVMRARLEGTIMAHSPGHMLVLDCTDADMIGACQD